MDFFAWPHLQKDLVSQDNVYSFWVPGTQGNIWQWEDNYPTNVCFVSPTSPVIDADQRSISIFLKLFLLESQISTVPIHSKVPIHSLAPTMPTPTLALHHKNHR